MDKEISNKKKKRTYLLRIGMMILTLVLIVLFVLMMALVSRIQGTGRVVNYAGLVRGKTQRIIKLEDAGKPQDQMLQDVQDYIDGLRGGSDKLQLVRLEDKKFQSKMKELDDYFQSGRKDTSIHRLLKRVKSFSKYVMKQPDLRKYIQIKEHQHWMYWKKL